jgi:LruC domain-containing protein
MRISHSKISAILFFFILIASTYSCKEDYYDPYYKAPSPFTGVPDSFDWSTVSSINLTVNVNDEYNGEYYYIVEVFDSNPILNTKATLLSKGVAKKGEAFTSEINFPQALQTIYIRQTGPNGLSVVQERTIDAKNITVNFSGESSSATVKSKAIKTRSTTYPTYQGNRNEASVINLSNSSQLLTAGKSYVITNGTYSGNIVFWGGATTTLFVEGEWNVPSNQSDLQNGLEIVILNGGKITFNNNNQTIQGNGNVNLFIMNGGIFNTTKKDISINFSNSGGNIYNFGELNLTQMKLNGGIFYNNSKTMDIAEFNQAGTIENHSILTLGSINSTYGLTIENYCNMSVSGGITASGATFNLHSNTILACANFNPKGTTVNMDSYSLFDVAGTTTFDSWSSTLNGTGTNYALARMKKVICNGSGAVTYNGNLELECTDHTANEKYTKIYSLNAPAHMVNYGSPTVLIPASECTGKGSYPAGTTPADPVFPIEVPTSSIYTYAIEDYWPAYGDYDMNDLVLESQTSYSLDKKNILASMTITAKLIAVGAKKKLGAAFQLDRVSANSISSISIVSDSPNNRLNGTVFTIGSTGIESEQNLAVIPLFDEAHKFLLNSGNEQFNILNTSENLQYITPKQVTVTINFDKKSKVTPTDIAVKYLNFFIVTDAKTENRKEVHLAGYAPTDKSIQDYFGGGPNNNPSNNDLSLNGVYYRGTDNLIWGLIIPGTFNYPKENESILNAYPKFKDWATSGGVNSQDWYSNSNGNTTYIYTINP